MRIGGDRERHNGWQATERLLDGTFRDGEDVCESAGEELIWTEGLVVPVASATETLGLTAGVEEMVTFQVAVGSMLPTASVCRRPVERCKSRWRRRRALPAPFNEVTTFVLAVAPYDVEDNAPVCMPGDRIVAVQDERKRLGGASRWSGQ